MSPELGASLGVRASLGVGPGAGTELTTQAPSAPTLESNLTVVVSDLIENPAVRYTMVVLHVLAILVASVGNGFLIVFICRHWSQTHRNVTALLILNLAVCDLISVVVQQPMKLVDILVYQEENLAYCQLSGFFTAFFSGVAFGCMTAIAQERFLLICHPFQAKRFLTLRNTVIVMVCIWLGVAVCAVPLPIVFIYVQPVQLEGGLAKFCLIDMDTTTSVRPDIYVSVLFIIFFLAPLVIISLSYITIFRALSHALPGQRPPSEASRRVLRQRRSLAKVMLSVAVIFVVSNGPNWVMMLVGVSNHEMEDNAIFTMLFIELLTMISPMMNPIVYSIRFRTVRKGLTHGGSIYSALKHMSLNRNSASLGRRENSLSQPRSGSDSGRGRGVSVVDTDRDLSPISEERRGEEEGERVPLSVGSHSSSESSVQSESV